MYSTRPLSSVSTEPPLVDATLICAAPAAAADGLADEGLGDDERAEEAFGFDELSEELPPPQAATERRTAASTDVWTMCCLRMISPSHRVPWAWTCSKRYGPVVRSVQRLRDRIRTVMISGRLKVRSARRPGCSVSPGQCTTTGGTASSSSRCVSSRLRGRNIAGITVSSTIDHATQ